MYQSITSAPRHSYNYILKSQHFTAILNEQLWIRRNYSAISCSTVFLLLPPQKVHHASAAFRCDGNCSHRTAMGLIQPLIDLLWTVLLGRIFYTLPQGCANHARMVARQIEFRTVVPNMFSTITVGFFIITQKWVSAHVQFAESAR